MVDLNLNFKRFILISRVTNFNLSIKKKDAKQVFEVFDKKYEGKVDAHYIGDMLRSLNLAVTNAECEKRGQTPKPGTKQISVEEFLAIYSEFYKMPEQTFGTYEDFMEGLKLYDKESNGLLSLGELSQVLVAMGKRWRFKLASLL